MAERENSVWGKIRVQLSDVQNYLLNGKYREAVILDKEILALLVRMQNESGGDGAYHGGVFPRCTA